MLQEQLFFAGHSIFNLTITVTMYFHISYTTELIIQSYNYCHNVFSFFFHTPIEYKFLYQSLT